MFHCSTATVSVRNVGPLREHKHTDGLSHVLIAVPIMFCSRSPDFNQSFLEFILERRLIDLLLHDPSVFVIGQIEVRAVGGLHIRRDEVCLGFRAPTVQSFCTPMRWCAVLVSRVG